MADIYRNPADTSAMNTRSADWYEPMVQQGWTCQSRTICPPYVTSGEVYGHGGAEPYTALYYDDPNDPDIVKPTVSIEVDGTLNDAETAYVDSATVTITADDEHSEIDSIEYRVNAGSWTPYTAPVEFDEVGSYTVDARATDEAENVSDVESVEFDVEAA